MKEDIAVQDAVTLITEAAVNIKRQRFHLKSLGGKPDEFSTLRH